MDTPTKNQARRYTVEEWEQMKPKIRDLIVNEKRKLKDVMRILEEDLGFAVSEKQVKSRITKWGFDTKNIKADAMLVMARTKAKRRRLENKESAFRINKQPVDPGKINRYLKRKQISESSLLDMASPVDAASPAISVFTPRPDPPHSDVLCSSTDINQHAFSLPLPSSTHRIAGAEDIALHDSALQALSPQISSSQLSPICLRSLWSALQSGDSFRKGDLRLDNNCLSKFESRLIHSPYLTRPVSNINQPVNGLGSARLSTPHSTFLTLPIWPLLAEACSLCFGNPVKTALQEAQNLVKVLLNLNIPDARLDLPLILRTAEELQYFWIACTNEALRIMCLRVLHQKFPETIGPPFQESPLASRLYYYLEDTKFGKPYFGHSHELFPLIVFSLHSDTQMDIDGVRARWEQLSKSHMSDISRLEHYSGRCWAAAEEYWRQGSVKGSPTSSQILPVASAALDSHEVDQIKEHSNEELLSRRLWRWVRIFERIKIYRRFFEIEYRVFGGLWELNMVDRNFGMKFIPKLLPEEITWVDWEWR